MYQKCKERKRHIRLKKKKKEKKKKKKVRTDNCAIVLYYFNLIFYAKRIRNINIVCIFYGIYRKKG